MLGIIGAMEEEIMQLKAKMNVEQIKTLKKLKFYIGTLDNKNIVVVRCGIGKVNAALCTQIMIDNFDIEAVINTGVAGGLNDKLNIGDIVISSDAVHHDFDTTKFGDPIGYISRMDMKDAFFKADTKLINLAEQAGKTMTDIKVFVGRIASGDQFISTKETKDKIKNDCDAYCVEMEGAAIAHACYINEIPFLIIRAISDNADDSSDISFEEFVNKAAQNAGNMIEKIVNCF